MPIRVASGFGSACGGLASVVAPVLTLGIDSFTGNRSGSLAALALSSMRDTEKLLAREESLIESPRVEAALQAFASRRTSKTATSSDDAALFRQLRESRERTQTLLSSNLAGKFAFLSANDPESVAVREHYGLAGATETDSKAIAAFTAQAIKNNVSQFVSVKFIENSCDTHGGTNAQHVERVYSAFEAVALLTDDLSKSPAPAPLSGSWLDNTTIVMFSEFSRTPLFNKYTLRGRDHHFANSCLLIGAGVRGGTVVGSTTEVGGMQPRVFNFESFESLGDTGKVQGPNRRHIVPEDIGATILASAGLGYEEYRFGRPLWPVLTARPR
jgi:hypothetical protein